MKNVFIQGSSVLLSTFLLVGCGDGACCEDGKRVLSDNGTIVKKEEQKNEPKDFEVPNIVPTAIAYANDSLEMIKIATCESVHFDGSSSYDPDGNDQNLSYMWSDMNSTIMSNEKSFTHRYDKKGIYETTLVVTDEQNLTANERVCVLVNIDEDDIPLIARAGEDIEINSDKKVSLSGRGICRDDIAKYEWKEGDNLLSLESSFDISFEAGEHTLILTIEDIEGDKAFDSVTINVI